MSLTKRESEIIQRAALGETADEIAAFYGRSVETVRTQIKLARERLEARNMAHLVAISISKGFIQALCIALVVSSLLSPFDAVRSKTTQRLTRRPEAASHIA